MSGEVGLRRPSGLASRSRLKPRDAAMRRCTSRAGAVKALSTNVARRHFVVIESSYCSFGTGTKCGILTHGELRNERETTRKDPLPGNTIPVEMSAHITRPIDADVEDLTAIIAEMGGHTEKQIIEAIDALSRGDANHGKRVISADAALDALQREVEQKAILTIATRQPVADDLREIVAIIRIANDLERIGDLGKNIGKRVIGINGEDVPRKAMRGVRHMAQLVLGQLQEVLDSFASRDSARAIEIWNRDEEVDSMYTSLFREVLTYMMEDPGMMGFGIHLLFCAKNIERMGDHATNIAEAVYYMVEGRMLLDERRKADTTSMLSVSFSA